MSVGFGCGFGRGFVVGVGLVIVFGLLVGFVDGGGGRWLNFCLRYVNYVFGLFFNNVLLKVIGDRLLCLLSLL